MEKGRLTVLLLTRMNAALVGFLNEGVTRMNQMQGQCHCYGYLVLKI